MPKIPRKDLPSFVRRCWEASRKASEEQRKAEIERLNFYVGKQWRPEEVSKREGQKRPYTTINKCKPAVDQIEGDIRMNPPGPQAHPVGGGADKDGADIIEGLIREVEYRSSAKTAYSTAGKYSAASGYGVLELATEFVSDRGFAQQLVIKSVEDPSIVFFDPAARMANRQDASWAGKLKMYSTREDYIAAFGTKRRVLESRGVQRAMGWIQDAMGVNGELAQINEWTGEGKGPFYACEFYMVETDPEKQRVYSDNIVRFDGEPVPKGVKAKEGDEYIRTVPRRKICKYLVDALESSDETEWQGTIIPLIPVLGPEVYIDGKLHRLSLIHGAIDAQRALNYVATTAVELGGLLPKAPFIGPKGSFDDPRWQTANTEMWAYLEYTPVFVTNETTGAQQLANAPQRNMWEAPIQWLLALATYFSDSIKAVTAIYDPSLGAQKGDQSGRAIEQLRSESSVGNYSYSDNLHRAIEVLYNQCCIIFPKILDGPRVVTIVRPDSQHEIAEINQEFPNGIDPRTGKKGKSNNIALGLYSVRVTAGPSFETRQDKAIEALTEFFRAAPQALAAPGVAAAYMRLIGEGNPKVEQMADLLAPSQGDTSPEQAQQQLMQVQQQNQALTQLVQKMQQAIQAKLPEVEASKFKALLDNLTKIRVAEITASKDLDRNKADNLAAMMEHITGMAHDAGLQAQDHAHERTMQAGDQAHDMSTQAADQAHDATMATVPPPVDPNKPVAQPNGAA